jgi:hypothetical protein
MKEWVITLKKQVPGILLILFSSVAHVRVLGVWSKNDFNETFRLVFYHAHLQMRQV